MKQIYMRATSQRAKEAGFAPAHDLAMIPVMVDLDKLSPAARWIAEQITATYVTDELLHKCMIVAESGMSMADRDRAKGVSEAMIERRAKAWDDAYTDKMTIHVTFPILNRQPPEQVIEAAVSQLVHAGTARLYVPQSDAQYSF